MKQPMQKLMQSLCEPVELSTSHFTELTKSNHFWSRAASAFLFGANFLKHPQMVGALVPSSRFLVDRVLSSIEWSRALSFVEYGPGTGAITREIISRMRGDARLLAVEANRSFVEHLQNLIRDRRLHLIGGSAADAQLHLTRLNMPQVDYVISGIPLSLMTKAARSQVFETTHAILRPKGTFIVYQYTRTTLAELQSIFSVVRPDYVRGKVLPLCLFNCTK